MHMEKGPEYHKKVTDLQSIFGEHITAEQKKFTNTLLNMHTHDEPVKSLEHAYQNFHDSIEKIHANISSQLQSDEKDSLENHKNANIVWARNIVEKVKSSGKFD